MLKMYEESQATDNPKTLGDIVNPFMKADKRSDYHPRRGYGPPAVGKSSRKLTGMRELEARLEATQVELREERTLRQEQAEQLAIITQLLKQLFENLPNISRLPSSPPPSPDNEDNEGSTDEE